MRTAYRTVSTTTCGHRPTCVVAFANGDLHRAFLACRDCLTQRLRLAFRLADGGVVVAEPIRQKEASSDATT